MRLSDQKDIIADNQISAPVSVVRIAHELGLKVYGTDNFPNNISGMIKKDKDRGGSSGYAIFYNNKHARVRQRFTIAHEIAHYILHQSFIGDGIAEDALLRTEGLSNGIERQANALAADILMPWTLLKPTLEINSNIEVLANQFEVSRDAMSYRVLGLSFDDAQASGLAAE